MLYEISYRKLEQNIVLFRCFGSVLWYTSLNRIRKTVFPFRIYIVPPFCEEASRTEECAGADPQSGPAGPGCPQPHSPAQARLSREGRHRYRYNVKIGFCPKLNYTWGDGGWGSVSNKKYSYHQCFGSA